MSQSNDKKKRGTPSLALVWLAWLFIAGQALLAAGSIYNYHRTSGSDEAARNRLPWDLLGQGATRVRLVAGQAQPDVLGNIAVFLAVANALGLAALTLGLICWSRSKHTSGRLTISAAITVVLINSLLNLPYW
ncbi:MAG: hypothetical protein JSW27_18930 [Phycisphaerales bacterium]|nr:MAG: hypothetical protein JSW27_18930 [Phycisphaerales bacterium]